MNKRNRIALSIIMTIVILFQLSPNSLLLIGEVAFAASPNDIKIVNGKEFVNGYQNTCNYDSSKYIPPNNPICSSNNYKFNADIYEKMNLIVYGDPNTPESPPNLLSEID